MTDLYAYTGEIRLICGEVLIPDWQPCDGRLLQIPNHEPLFSLIYNLYGGDGETSFALPDLRGRVPVHRSTTVPVGKRGGAEKVRVDPDGMPAHTHTLAAANGLGAQPSPAGNALAESGAIAMYDSAAPDTALAFTTLTQTVGPGGFVHENMPPYVAIGSYMICVDGQWPSRPEGE